MQSLHKVLNGATSAGCTLRSFEENFRHLASCFVIVTLLLGLPNRAVASNVNLTGQWTGTATTKGPNMVNGTWQASAVITQTATALKATVVFSGNGDVALTFTETGTIQTTTISIGPTSDEDTKATGTISSNGMSGTGGSTSDSETWKGSFVLQGSTLSGSATGSEGDTVTWTMQGKSTLSVMTGALVCGVTGVAYSQTISATGGSPPYTWSLAAGQLPPGVTLSSTGVLSGTPTTAGTFKFTVRVKDTQGAVASGNFSINIKTVSSVIVQPNVNCKITLSPFCSANIVLADGFETTALAVIVEPAQSLILALSTTTGAVTSEMTDTSGLATSTYTSKILSLGNVNTGVGTISGQICKKTFPNLTTIFNYHGFNFHQSQVTNTTFTNPSALNISAIQSFFVGHQSFLAKFILVGTKGGFIDSNGNGKLDAGEPVYVAVTGTVIPIGSTGTKASTVFANASAAQGINPEVLIATAEKENSLISSTSLPSQAVLNFAMGCGAASNFLSQISCSATTLNHRFHDTTAFGRGVVYPFFFHSTDNIRHSVTNLGRQAVAFQADTAATYAQYRYTPFIQSVPTGGGVYLFEKIWAKFGF